MGWTKHTQYSSRLNVASEGFALPTVLVASVVMMIVLLAALTGVSSVSSGLRNQYIDQIGRAAAKSGLAMANACMKKSGGAITWTDATPLKPNTNCTGTETLTCPSTSTDPACYVLKNGNYRTTFSVGVVTNSGGTPTDLNSKGIVREVRKTTGDVVTQYNNTLKAAINGATTQIISANDSLAGSVISDTNGDALSIDAAGPHTSSFNIYASHVCGIRASDDVTVCSSNSNTNPSTAFQNSPLGSTPMKAVSVGIVGPTSTSFTTYASYVCGIQASDSVVACSSNSSTNPSTAFQNSPLGSTAMKDLSIRYTYCGINSTLQAVCTTSTSTSPFGTTSMKTVSVVMNNTSSVCGIYTSNNQVICAAISANPFGTSSMKDVSVNTASGFAACAIYASNSQVACTTTDSTTPFSTNQLSNIAVSVGTTGGYNTRICGVKLTDSQATCASTISATPFGATTMKDVSVAVSGTTNGEYVCGIKASDSTVICVTSITATPFAAGIKMLDVAVATDSDAYVCAIYSSTKEVNCVAVADSPFSTTTLDATPASSISSYIIY